MVAYVLCQEISQVLPSVLRCCVLFYRRVLSFGGFASFCMCGCVLHRTDMHGTTINTVEASSKITWSLWELSLLLTWSRARQTPSSHTPWLTDIVLVLLPGAWQITGIEVVLFRLICFCHASGCNTCRTVFKRRERGRMWAFEYLGFDKNFSDQVLFDDISLCYCGGRTIFSSSK